MRKFAAIALLLALLVSGCGGEARQAAESAPPGEIVESYAGTAVTVAPMEPGEEAARLLKNVSAALGEDIRAYNYESADAAAVLAGLDRIYNTGLSYETLSGLAARLGADVPFMLRGGTARATGIGEVLEPLPALREITEYAEREKETFWDEYKRLDNPHVYKVDLSEKLYNIKNALISEIRGENG